MNFISILETDFQKNLKVKEINEHINKKLETLLLSKNYGSGVLQWEHRIYCNTIDFYKSSFLKEIKLYELHKKNIKTSRWIDKDQILISHDAEIYRIIAESILTSLLFLSNLEEFSFNDLRRDIINLFRNEGWIYTKFFMTGEVDAVFGEKLNFGPNSVAEKIKSEVSTRDYGSGINYWGHIIICCGPEAYNAGFFKEIKKFSINSGELELRLRVDYDMMLHANQRETNFLISQSVLRGIDLAEKDLRIKNFDFNKFRTNLNNLFKREGWIN